MHNYDFDIILFSDIKLIKFNINKKLFSKVILIKPLNELKKKTMEVENLSGKDVLLHQI